MSRWRRTSFHRTGPGVEYGYDDAGMEAGIKLLGQLKADEMAADALAAVSFLKRKNFVIGNKIGAMGFCVGGHMTYLTACETDVAAAASFYGGRDRRRARLWRPCRQPSVGPGRSKAVCCVSFGGKDAHIPMSDVDTVRGALESNDIPHEVVVYPEADHGFFL